MIHYAKQRANLYLYKDGRMVPVHGPQYIAPDDQDIRIILNLLHSFRAPGQWPPQGLVRSDGSGISVAETLPGTAQDIHYTAELQTTVHTKVLATQAFSWLKAAASDFTFKTLLRH